MKKLSGGTHLECGHTQVLSEYRLALAHAGAVQRPVWCIECEDYSTVVPHVPVNSQEDELEQ